MNGNIISIVPQPFQPLRVGDILSFDSSINKPEFDTTFRQMEYVYSLTKKRLALGIRYVVLKHSISYNGGQHHEEFWLGELKLCEKIKAGGMISYGDDFINPLIFANYGDWCPLPPVRKLGNILGDDIGELMPAAGEVIAQRHKGKTIKALIWSVDLNYRPRLGRTGDVQIVFNNWHPFNYHLRSEMPKRYMRTSERELLPAKQLKVA